MELDNIITLQDENGEDVRFEFLDLVEYAGNEYVVLLPVEDDDGQVVILQLEESDDDEVENYVGVDDDETLNAIFAIFKEKFKDEFKFED
ncbi:DUF1292 domain-containing protein [Subdoligranulum sp. DSM 109015]|uniref:DUF1292 domain-containing protein n=2 Tax=Gemmiger gallinarum TaxID=2779354 RepID=A0ABR9R223_9FIRM|nr:DUF1292 domain-containing protein [Gemmiger gallinarum]MBE5037153.1 DUF1292 domain-containing protein [Gemmiger gallinarum]